MSDDMNGFVYKPCMKCGSVTYNNTDGEKFVELPDGRLAVTPSTCDKCEFDLMMNEQKELH